MVMHLTCLLRTPRGTRVLGNLPSLLAAAFMLSLLTGCGAGNLDSYQRFAAAGAAFSGTVPAVVEESFALSVRNNSQQLRDFRDQDEVSSDCLKQLRTHDGDLQTRLEIL